MTYHIQLSDEDYLRFNMFHVRCSPMGRRQVRKLRVLYPVVCAVTTAVLFLIMRVREPAVMALELAVMAAVAVILCVRVPRDLEKNVERNIRRMKMDGKLPYDADSEVELDETGIVSRTDRGETRIGYKDVEGIYSESDYLYIYFGAVQALIFPARCLGGEKENVTAFLRERCPSAKS